MSPGLAFGAAGGVGGGPMSPWVACAVKGGAGGGLMPPGLAPGGGGLGAGGGHGWTAGATSIEAPVPSTGHGALRVSAGTPGPTAVVSQTSAVLHALKVSGIITVAKLSTSIAYSQAKYSNR